MKFVLNGGLILGTLDGANVEIKEEIGDDNIFIFGATADRVEDLRHDNRYRRPEMNKDLSSVIEFIRKGSFGHAGIYDSLLGKNYLLGYSLVWIGVLNCFSILATLSSGGDHYLVSHDFGSYLDAQSKIDEAYLNESNWAQRSILCTAGMGKFSSDRSIQEYADQIWNVKPCKVEIK